MGYFGRHWKIDGLDAGPITRGRQNGRYTVTFERENASLEQIEAINWAAPSIQRLSGRDGAGLPEGYGFEVTDIQYRNGVKAYDVALQVARQYLGDVTSYQAQVDQLAEDNAAKQSEIRRLEEQLAEADEAAIAMYEAFVLGGAEKEGGE